MRVEKKEGLKKIKIHHSKKIFFSIVFLFVVLIGIVISIIYLENQKIKELEIANPASVYCIQNGGRLEMRETSEGQTGYCLLNGKECEEWSFFRGECSLSSLTSCVVDGDCVPSSCCHASSCVTLDNAPKCDGAFCTLSCEPNTLDCGQASCKCVDSKCGVVKK
jgi:putative hemolysin